MPNIQCLVRSNKVSIIGITVDSMPALWLVHSSLVCYSNILALLNGIDENEVRNSETKSYAGVPYFFTNFVNIEREIIVILTCCYASLSIGQTLPLKLMSSKY